MDPYTWHDVYFLSWLVFFPSSSLLLSSSSAINNILSNVSIEILNKPQIFMSIDQPWWIHRKSRIRLTIMNYSIVCRTPSVASLLKNLKSIVELSIHFRVDSLTSTYGAIERLRSAILAILFHEIKQVNMKSHAH